METILIRGSTRNATSSTSSSQARRGLPYVLLLVSLLIPVLSLLGGPHIAEATTITVFGDPGCVSSVSGRIDCVIRTEDGSAWYSSWTGSSWSAWAPLGGVLDSAPAISSWGANRFDVFGVGQDETLWHISWAGSSWSAWESLGGKLKFSPDCASWGPDEIDCFATGSDNAVWHIRWSGGGWGSWESIGGVASSGPAVASVASGNLYVYIAGQEGALWGNKWDGTGWSGWTPVPMAGMPGGIISSQTKPACVANGLVAGEIDCFARGTDTALWHTHLGSGIWESLGGSIDSSPAASTWGTGWLDVFGQGTDKGLWHIAWSGAGWGAWEPVPMETSPATSATESTTESTTTVTVSNTVTVKVTTQTAPTIPFIGLPETILAILLGFLVVGILRIRRRLNR
jgi:hypothetical protein